MYHDLTPPEGGAWLPLYHGNRLAELALVDLEDLPRLLPYLWRVDRDGYAYRTATWEDGARTQYPLASEIMHLPPRADGDVVDHRDGEPLDCRKSNLRIVSTPINLQNRRNRSGSASRHRNVSRHAKSGKWVVSLYVNGVRHYGGVFADEDEAGRIAAAMRRRLMPGAVG